MPLLFEEALPPPPGLLEHDADILWRRGLTGPAQTRVVARPQDGIAFQASRTLDRLRAPFDRIDGGAAFTTPYVLNPQLRQLRFHLLPIAGRTPVTFRMSTLGTDLLTILIAATFDEPRPHARPAYSE
jgi:hypothetical protein